MTATLSAGVTTGLERPFSEVLGDILGAGDVPVDAHFFDDLGADSMLMARFCARVRKRADLPSVSMKDVYAHPTVRGLAGALGPQASPFEQPFAQVLADVLGVGDVPVDGHFFDDLGADSMVMARFCARVRKRPDLPTVSMKDVYRHPTISSLAGGTVAPRATVPIDVPASAPVEPAARPVGTARYILCGTLQFLCFVGAAYLGAVVMAWSYEWVSAASDLFEIYRRAVVAGGAAFLGACLLPIVAKWVLIGRWTPRRIPVWSLAYLRFWIVKTLVRSNPLLLVAGGRSHTSGSSSLYVLYLRALGARIGRNVAIFSRTMPVCTDLLTIGDGTVIRKDAVFPGYHAHAGAIHTGAVTLGKGVVVGELAVLDIDTSLGDGAQLGHASSLRPGQAVPAGERWHGSPAQPTDVDYRSVGPARCGGVRRVTHAVTQLLTALLVFLPLTTGVAVFVLAEFPLLNWLDTAPPAFTTWTFYRNALIVSAVLFFGFLVVGLLVVFTVPRVLNLAIKPDTVYPLFGFRYSIHRTIGRLTNVKFFTYLFGDSSYIVHYLRALGYDLSTVEQTGSNFGTDVRHETPFHVSVGRGTMVADGLSVINADFSNTSFRLSQVSIGAHSFLGNSIAYPARNHVGENCLLATKVLIPLDGPIRHGVGLLGAPSFQIPRTVARDGRLGPASGAERWRRLRFKNRYNLRTMALALLVRWLHVFGVTLLAMSAADFYRLAGPAAVAAELVVATMFTAAYFVLVERAAVRFRGLRPRFCSIYDRYFWWHERYWKLVIPPFDKMLAGTPFKNLVSRLLGVRLGRRVFDDGAAMTERTLVAVGDDATLNAGVVIQCHSQEDGHFKSAHTTIGAGCTLGVSAFVHYGVNMGDGAVLGAGSFLMKGEDVPPGARWGGNPAQELRDTAGAGLLPTPIALTGRPRRFRPLHAAAALVALALLPAGVAVASGVPANGWGPTTPSAPLPATSAAPAPLAVPPAAAVPAEASAAEEDAAGAGAEAVGASDADGDDTDDTDVSGDVEPGASVPPAEPTPTAAPVSPRKTTPTTAAKQSPTTGRT